MNWTRCYIVGLEDVSCRSIRCQSNSPCVKKTNLISCPLSVCIRFDLDEWEHVTCMKTVALRSQETVSGLKGYIAAGTCLMQGEEVTCRGRVSSTQQLHHNTDFFLFVQNGDNKKQKHLLMACCLILVFRLWSWMWSRWFQSRASRSPRTSSKCCMRRNRRDRWQLCATATGTWCQPSDRRYLGITLGIHTTRIRIRIE